MPKSYNVSFEQIDVMGWASHTLMKNVHSHSAVVSIYQTSTRQQSHNIPSRLCDSALS